ncbi:hypothetical protein [uncultured Megamonas sp.]|uniref:hypothetical protein n=1 Tax=uncultured Megamonas sp. TaxID=286140 RepID=UPI001874A72E|nr:hypothetical protein [uncultured Megamonas sp.]MBE5060046.1 hypothetical protein [Megamonas funiformis]
MDLKFLDVDDTKVKALKINELNADSDSEFEKLKKENLLLKQKLADIRADNFLILYEDLKRENAIILKEITSLKNSLKSKKINLDLELFK